MLITHADKTSESKTQAVANRLSKGVADSEPVFQPFNHPGAIAQRKLQEMAGTSPRTMQLKALQEMADKSPQAGRAGQLQAMSDNSPANRQPLTHESRGEAEYQPLMDEPAGSLPPVQLMNYRRYAGFLGTFNLSSYTPKEKDINKLEAEAVKTYNRIHDRVLNNPVFSKKIVSLNAELSAARTEQCEASTYDAVETKLRKIITDSKAIFVEYAATEKNLTDTLSDSLEVVDESVSRSERGENQVTASELKDIKRVLHKIYVSNTSVISIELEMGETFDLAHRSGELDKPVPEGLVAVEMRIKHLMEQKEAEEEAIFVEMGKPGADKPALRKAKDALWKDDILEELKVNYKELVNKYVRDQTLLDLISISQTKVGREMLTEMGSQKYEQNAKVVIGVRDKYVAATGGPSKSGGAKVTYAPQGIRDRDTENRAGGGALPRLAELAHTNPWQENDRSDITLFHELVHAHHVQDKTVIDKDKLMTNEEAVHPADRRFMGTGLAQDAERGVPEEEYYTVGLGKHSGARFTENKYRAARRALGEDSVSPRTQYTHVNDRGERVGDESAM